MQRVNLDSHRGLRGKLSLRSLTLRPQPPQCPLVLGGVALELALEITYAMLKHPIVKIFASKMRVACCSSDLEDPILDSKD
mmetsp:Transcript_128703/g.223202  ORF Transcript_128703/g.223202 Transcript_128703/m.223202 type:complete len:81 (-) Transcript_128703:815-1057(-)